MKWVLLIGGGAIGAFIGSGGEGPGMIVMGLGGAVLGWGLWLLGSAYNAISGRRESLFD